MKTLITILTFALLIVSLSIPCWATEATLSDDCVKSEYGDYSYQGHIDPQIITSEWVFLEDQCNPIGPGVMEAYWQNPKSFSEIPVAVFLVFQGSFLGYAYLHGGDVYLYLFDLDSKCYIGKELEGEAKDLFKKRLGEAMGMRSL